MLPICCSAELGVVTCFGMIRWERIHKRNDSFSIHLIATWATIHRLTANAHEVSNRQTLRNAAIKLHQNYRHVIASTQVRITRLKRMYMYYQSTDGRSAERPSPWELPERPPLDIYVCKWISIRAIEFFCPSFKQSPNCPIGLLSNWVPPHLLRNNHSPPPD